MEWSSPLWNYKDYADYIELKTESGKTLQSRDYVQLTNSYDYLYRDMTGNSVMSLKAPIHEMGHILGLQDLYNSSMASPVYYMSAMSNAISPVPQEISIKEKEALGWVVLREPNPMRLVEKGSPFRLRVRPRSRLRKYREIPSPFGLKAFMSPMFILGE